MEASSSTGNQKRKIHNIRKPDGTRIVRSEFDIINEKLRSIPHPLVDLHPVQYETKFLGRYRLFVGNISNAVSKDDFEGLFKVFGEVNDVFLQQNKSFGFVRMDYFHNAIKAKHQLNGNVLKDRKIYVTFSPLASITVKHLSPSVSNELLHIAFSVFGEIEYSFIITDKRGKSTGEGVVDFVKKNSAMAAKKYCTDHMFFVTSSLKPITVEEYVTPIDMDGLPEETIRKTHTHYEERELGPRFAMPGSFEYEHAQRFKELWENYNMKFSMLKAELKSEEHKLDMELMRARYDHETERLKTMIRQRELEKERYCQRIDNIDNEVRQTQMVKSHLLEDPSLVAFKLPENLFMPANQLNDMLDLEEREMKGQWRRAEYRSDYEMGNYQQAYFDHANENHRKVPDDSVHCKKRQRFE